REIKSPVSPEGFSPFSGSSTVLSHVSKAKPQAKPLFHQAFWTNLTSGDGKVMNQSPQFQPQTHS
ncbi:MAG: hypothetical protein JJU29_21335, partial [Verrucomicrobia bacterium]|nr:hypothetical protein [Verrucomicrobiota bacterium]